MPVPPTSPSGWRRARCSGTAHAACRYTHGMFAVVLVHPEIPPNTGNVIRLTANSGCDLHLVQPLGFRMDDRDLRRAGLDYHEHARVRVHPDYTACRDALDAAAPRRHFAFTTQATRAPDDVAFRAGDALVFGSETAGLPDEVLATFAPDARLRIPMLATSRSLNLSNAVAIAVYAAWRQLHYAGARACGVDVMPRDGAPVRPRD